MDGQPLLLLFSVHVVYNISTARRCGKPAPFSRLALRRVNSRAFYAELSGDMRISALKVRVLCSDPKTI